MLSLLRNGHSVFLSAKLFTWDFSAPSVSTRDQFVCLAFSVRTKQLLLSNLGRCTIPGKWEILQASISWCSGLNQRHHVYVQPYRKALCWGQTPRDPQPSHLLYSSNAFILNWDFLLSYWETQGSRRKDKDMWNAKSTFLLPEGFLTSVLVQRWVHSKTVLLLSWPASSVSP